MHSKKKKDHNHKNTIITIYRNLGKYHSKIRKLGEGKGRKNKRKKGKTRKDRE